ncbi:fimbrial protein [Silvimonas amylolytica]|uniref:Ferrous iron transporter B n=1 Tax=Silvimonas amylolytica TaxID=449663 RepID=A0ABQ2PID2_9NEIS|nr:fimbrial protein [Silvimonas amylolytica]GGP25090.1 ferrous iron transporter B [Silvimonas amylolytica]
MKKLIGLLATLALGYTAQSFAVDADLYFTGTLTAPSCTVDGDATVQLPPALTHDMNAAGAPTTFSPTAFNISLSNCTNVETVTMTLSATTDTLPSVLKNTGTAGGVGVQLLKANAVNDKTGTPLDFTAPLVMSKIDSNTVMTIPFVAQYYVLAQPVTPGKVAAMATFNFTYK